MTPSQEKIYKYISKYQKKHGLVPSARYTSTIFGMTQQGMHLHYKALMRLGKLEKIEKVEEYRLVDNSTITR